MTRKFTKNGDIIYLQNALPQNLDPHKVSKLIFECSRASRWFALTLNLVVYARTQWQAGALEAVDAQLDHYCEPAIANSWARECDGIIRSALIDIRDQIIGMLRAESQRRHAARVLDQAGSA